VRSNQLNGGAFNDVDDIAKKFPAPAELRRRSLVIHPRDARFPDLLSKLITSVQRGTGSAEVGFSAVAPHAGEKIEMHVAQRDAKRPVG